MDCYVRLERKNIKELIDEVERSEVMFLLVGVGVSTAWRAGLDLRFGVVDFRLSVSRILYCYFQFWTHISDCLLSPTVLTSSPSMDSAPEVEVSPAPEARC